MRLSHVGPIVLLMAAASGSLGAQVVLRASLSGRALSEVTLSAPRTAGAAATMAPMAGMAPMGGMAPAPTPAAAPKPTVIRLDYGQPHLRGRLLHTDSLVPYGKAWRMGANGNTTLTTDVDLVVGGAPLSKGTYVLYAIPAQAGWTLVIQRSVGQSPMSYSDSADVARIALQHTTLMHPVESLTMWLIPSTQLGPARGELRFAWGVAQLSTTWSLR